MKLGIDVDGVICDFNSAYIDKVIAVTGRDLFPPRPFDIPCWNYPESYGYTEAEVADVWNHIKADPLFWYRLPEYPETMAALHYLAERVMRHEDDLYFITARPGVQAKAQTEDWLRAHLPAFVTPTVLITSHKGLAAQTLGLDVYIDDRWENALSVASCHWSGQAPGCQSLLLDRPWNRHANERAHDVRRVTSVVGMAGLEIGRVGAFEGTPRLKTSEQSATA